MHLINAFAVSLYYYCYPSSKEPLNVNRGSLNSSEILRLADDDTMYVYLRVFPFSSVLCPGTALNMWGANATRTVAAI